jgi:acyl CoA:acetate/3-ketoacid CoA transferase alpha subunit
MYRNKSLVGGHMRTSLIIPETLIQEAMDLTDIKTKTGVVKIALENLIQKEKVKNLNKYYGKINLDIDMDRLRKR